MKVARLLLLLPAFAACASVEEELVHPGYESPTVYDEILPLRERAALHDELVAKRLDRVIPPLMREVGIDTWVLIAREYNEDPVLETMLPANRFAARRRTILVFHDNGQSVERFAVSRYPVGDFFAAMWDPETEPDQWKRLAELLDERGPRKIALNGSTRYGHADGLTHFEHEAFVQALSPALRERVVFDDRLGVGWLETRIEEEIEHYRTMCAIAHAIIAEGFSRVAVTPGETTTKDVEWWYRERIAGLKLGLWFHPHVSLQRSEAEERSRSFAVSQGDGVIERGDLLHVDLGITYLGLNTDTQQHAYVLRKEEVDAPAGLREGLATGNRLQDCLTTSFVTGRTGNEILAAAKKKALDAGIDNSIYTHPLGNHGHGAGPTIGMWDKQNGVPGSGDYALRPNSAFSIELNARVRIPEWGDKETLVMLEEDAFFDGAGVDYLDGRQLRLLLIP